MDFHKKKGHPYETFNDLSGHTILSSRLSNVSNHRIFFQNRIRMNMLGRILLESRNDERFCEI